MLLYDAHCCDIKSCRLPAYCYFFLSIFRLYVIFLKQFCGDVIAGLSLLSDSVMRLTMVSHEQDYREDFLLPRRSLYIMK